MGNLEVGDLILCTVDRIVGTVVFVKIDGDGEGSIIVSEIAPGRIRNLRDYVVPKKRIVCKVLRVSGDRIDLSLRRVSQKEQKEVLESHNKEKSYVSILKSILGNKAEDIISKITKEEKLYDFLEEAKNFPQKLEKFMMGIDAQKILDILRAQKQKTTEIRREFTLTSKKPDGVSLIKKTLSEFKEVEIKYLGSGKYILKKESSDPKKADQLIREILEKVEKESKKIGLEFHFKEK
ncbi:hypothetical protein HYT23_01465 [Candidatus Pacearchaeota archaeon]|nr:hypothetical protein [Candidatus Pacearchaeota archaeon]